MGEVTGIEWTDGTWNPWWGCQEVGPGCAHCYAAALDARVGGDHFGAHADRRRTSAKNWNDPLRWNRQAEEFALIHGRRRRIFCGSMMDIMDNAVPLEWSLAAFARIEECSRIDWQPLTKRVGNVRRRIPDHWHFAWPKHVGLMITVVDQEEADRDIPKLIELKRDFHIPWIGLSMEPLLGPVDLTRVLCSGYKDTGGERISVGDLTVEMNDAILDGRSNSSRVPTINALGGDVERLLNLPAIDWVITGGESGPDARPGNPQWYRDLQHQCAEAGVPFFFKQWGEWVSVSEVAGEGPHFKFEDGRTVRRIGKKKAGSTLDGRHYKEFPRLVA